MELSPLDTLSICSDTVIGQYMGKGQIHITSGYRIWLQTAERNFNVLNYAIKTINIWEISLFGIVKNRRSHL